MSRLRIHFLSGSLKGQSRGWPRGSISVGRGRSNDIALPEDDYSSASGRHLNIFFDGGWKVQDLDSTNGTYLNGTRIGSDEPTELSHRDEIGLGSEVVFRIHLSRLSGFHWVVASLLAGLLLVGLFGLRSLVRIERGFEPVAERVTRSVYLLAAQTSSGREIAGTAFAVKDDGWLATNAHVAAALVELQASGAEAVAIRSDAPTEVHSVSSIVLHPEFEPGSFRNDVAVLRVFISERMKLEPLSFASEAALKELARGMRLGSVGFPATHTDAEHPRARLNVDVLADRRDGFLGVGLGVSPGMSGSPIIDVDGTVVGIVVGGAFADRVNWGLTPEPLIDLLAQIDERQ